MELKDKLKLLIDLKEISPYELAAKTGITEATISRILNQKTKSLSNGTLNLLANYFRVSRTWLKEGQESEPVFIEERTRPRNSHLINYGGTIANDSSSVGIDDQRTIIELLNENKILREKNERLHEKIQSLMEQIIAENKKDS